MMDFCKVPRILISCIDVIVRCPPGEQSAMRKPLGRAFFRLQCFLSRKECKDSRNSLLFLLLATVRTVDMENAPI